MQRGQHAASLKVLDPKRPIREADIDRSLPSIEEILTGLNDNFG